MANKRLTLPARTAPVVPSNPAAPAKTFNLSEKSQAAVIQFHRQAMQINNTQWNLREQMRNVDLQYNRENDWVQENVQAKLATKYGDTTKYRNIVFPTVMPAVETAVAYQANEFCSGAPLFEFVSDPDNEDAATQMTALTDDQAIRGAWVKQLIMAIRDGMKYNLGAVELDWDLCYVPAFETEVVSGTSQAKQVLWQGNVLRRLDLYNTVFDTRITPTEIPQKGEFAAYTQLLSRIELKKLINNFPQDEVVPNIKQAFESGTSASAGDASFANITAPYYIPYINPNAILDTQNLSAQMNWLDWAGLSGARDKPGGVNIAYKNLYELTILYARILPSDFNIAVPFANHPQVWKFWIVNHQVLIRAKRMTNAHNLIPIFFMSPLEDGLWYQTKSFAQNVAPVQEFNSALMNSIVAARRRAISDRTLYDPTRVSERHINSDNPSAKIPVRPAAYGKPLDQAVYPFPFRDDQSQFIMQNMAFFLSLSDKITGQNPARQGQFVKGNKTLHEYQDVQTSSTDRDQLATLMIEGQFMTPLKQVILLNNLQYASTGDVYSPSMKQTVSVDPVKLRQAALSFKIADGSMPVDKLLDADSWQTAIQSISSSPQLMQAYNLGPMFSYIFKTKGVDISAFEKPPQQVAYEQAVAQWQQAAELASKTGKEFNVPMPAPQQFGYNPNPAAQQQQPQQPGGPAQNGPANQ